MFPMIAVVVVIICSVFFGIPINKESNQLPNFDNNSLTSMGKSRQKQ